MLDGLIWPGGDFSRADRNPAGISSGWQTSKIENLGRADAGLPESSPDSTENAIKFRQCCHLPCQPPAPQSLKPRLLDLQPLADCFDALAAELKLAGECALAMHASF
jgi:hypothetical protein